MSKKTTRRKFVTTTAAAGTGFWVAGGIAPRPSRAAIDEISFASIGVGGKGASDSRAVGRHGNMVAICDIDEGNLGKAAARFTKAKKYFDYRKMLDEMNKTIDAVTVSTPDHNHAPASIRAMRMGIHCFTQKPMTHTIQEARLMGQIARENKLATQMGNQFTAHPNLRYCEAAFKKGSPLGKIKEVHIWTNRPVWPQGLGKPKDKPSTPSTVHWNEWLGPANERDYHQAYHPFKWRGWWEFGTGALGDMACHTVNMPFAALDLANPTSVVAETSGHNEETYPAWSVIDFAFPANDWRPGLKFRWYDGKKLPPQELLQGKKMVGSGALIVGEKGTLYALGDYAEAGLHWLGVDPPKVEYKKSIGHVEEWVAAIKGGEQAKSNFAEYAGPLTETILLGNLAVWAAKEPGKGKQIEWDAQKLVATNAPEVMHVVKKEYRQGWDIFPSA